MSLSILLRICDYLNCDIGDICAVSYTHLKYARNEDVPEHTLFVITTDGMENASRRYDSETVKKMIERQKE